MSELNFRYKVDSGVRTTLDTASSPQTAVYYWQNGSDYYTSQAHLEYINSLGLYTADVNNIMNSLKGDQDNEDILDIQETTFSNSIAQVLFTEITQDVSTTADEETDETAQLLKLDFTPNERGNRAIIDFSVSATASSNSDRTIVFQLFVGESGSETFKRSAKIFSDKSSGMRSGSCSLIYCYKIDSTNQHTALIKWGMNGGGSAEINVNDEEEYEHASLRMMEVRA